jgi:hypothetical protein
VLLTLRGVHIYNIACLVGRRVSTIRGISRNVDISGAASTAMDA